jgi:hypothetical protein
MAFDIDLFWSLPRCQNTYRIGDKYCALGAAYKAWGYNDAEVDCVDISLRENPWGLTLEQSTSIVTMNDMGLTVKQADRVHKISFQLTRLGRQEDAVTFMRRWTKPKPEKAKRMLLAMLIERKIPFKQDFITFKTPVKELCPSI